MIFVDTNYFLRFLLEDVLSQHEEAVRVFEDGATGKVTLYSSVIVFFEIYWVFHAYYQKEKAEVLEILTQVLQMKFVKFEQGDILRKAVGIYRTTHFDLEDAYNLVYAKVQKADEFKTFDRKLNAYFKKP